MFSTSELIVLSFIIGFLIPIIGLMEIDKLFLFFVELRNEYKDKDDYTNSK